MSQVTTEAEGKNSKKTQQVSAKKKNLTKKLDVETGKLLQQLREKVNKKSFGRKVRDNEILYLALTLVTPEHLVKLQENTLSEKDRLNMAHEEYVKNHGRISMDQFIGLLIRGEISPLKKETA